MREFLFKHPLKFFSISTLLIFIKAYMDQFERDAYQSHLHLGKFSLALDHRTSWLENFQSGSVQQFVAALAQAGLSNVQDCSRQLALDNPATINQAGEIIGNVTLPKVCTQGTTLLTQIPETETISNTSLYTNILRNTIPVEWHTTFNNTLELSIYLAFSIGIIYVAKRLLPSR